MKALSLAGLFFGRARGEAAMANGRGGADPRDREIRDKADADNAARLTSVIKRLDIV